MAETSFRIAGYKITLGTKDFAYVPAYPFNIRGKLECYGRHDDRCTIYFLTDYEAAPQPRYDEHEKHVQIFVSFREMPAYLDLVRNERPVYANFETDMGTSAYLSTRREPVGEEES